MKKKNRIIRIGIAIGIVVLAAMIGVLFWVKDAYHPLDRAYEVLEQDDLVKKTTTDYISFEPKNTEVTTGFIFYPGAKVEYEAYAPLCNLIAEKGYYVALVPMKWNLAILSPNRAEQVIAEHPNVKHWVIGGHSLGGVVASEFAASHSQIEGLVLLASYPKGNELEDVEFPVLSMYGSEDKVAKLEKVKTAMLGKNVVLYEIAGGNHAYFGSYGSQKGDGQALISNEEQIEKAVQYISAILDLVNTK